MLEPVLYYYYWIQHINKSSLNWLHRVNVVIKLPKHRTKKGGTNLNNACIGACHVRWSVNMLLIRLIQSTTEIMEYDLGKHSRKEKSKKDDISTVFKPVIDAMQSIFPSGESLKNTRLRTNVALVKRRKKKNKSTGSLRPASESGNLISITPK